MRLRFELNPTKTLFCETWQRCQPVCHMEEGTGRPRWQNGRLLIPSARPCHVMHYLKSRPCHALPSRHLTSHPAGPATQHPVSWFPGTVSCISATTNPHFKGTCLLIPILARHDPSHLPVSSGSFPSFLCLETRCILASTFESRLTSFWTFYQPCGLPCHTCNKW